MPNFISISYFRILDNSLIYYPQVNSDFFKSITMFFEKKLYILITI